MTNLFVAPGAPRLARLLSSALTALLFLLLLTGPARAQSVVVTGPTGSGQFGYRVMGLPSGNYVVTDPGFDLGGLTDVGAVYLYRGSDNTLISTLTGSRTNDRVGSGEVFVLTNGNFVVTSPTWGNGTAASVGAATWGSGSTGVSGVVSATNSLVGSTANDQVSGSGIYQLSNGNYVVGSQNWDNAGVADAGAVTWGSGSGGTVGVVSAANSLVGSSTNDHIGVGGVVALTGNGNYVVGSADWNNAGAGRAGAATWGSGTGGTVGAVGAVNSLVGSSANDNVGDFSTIKPLANGNYVVGTASWNNGSTLDVGAVTWGSGTAGVSGAISAANSLVGTTTGDAVGNAVTVLTNGNYVVGSSRWTNGSTAYVGAATWADGSTGLVGAVSAANSLVGTTPGDGVGNGVTALANGNYVVASPYWANGGVAQAGAATWANGSTGLVGTVTTANSLVGTQGYDQVGYGFGGNGVTALTNGHYVVGSPSWTNGSVAQAGAATWANGNTGLVGTVTTANSLVGTHNGDGVGTQVFALTGNGNYVVCSFNWTNGSATNAGAATWGRGTGITVGAVSAANSLVGTRTNDYVGEGGVLALTNGHYVVKSAYWANGSAATAGAMTWGNGTSGTVGMLSASNSLVGTRTDDEVGTIGSLALPTGAYAFRSFYWDNGTLTNAGAVTLGSPTGLIRGALSNCNSVLGGVANPSVILQFSYNPVADKLLVGLPAQNRVAIGVDIPLAPTGTTPQYLPATATVASLAATGTAIKWYAAATGGSALASTTALTDGNTYYATQTINGCESVTRLAVTAYLAPVISSLSATSGPEGTVITLTGLRFYGVTGVTLNGFAVTYNVVNSTTVTFTVPAGATSGNVVITTAAGPSNGVPFSVTPAITALSPGSGAMGSTFTITGTSLGGTTSVRLGGQPAAFVVNSATSLTVTVPAGANTHRVQVTTPSGSVLSAAAFGVDKFDSYNFPLVTTNFNSIAVFADATPTFTDLDGNGRLDLLVGKGDGTLAHYQQAAANSLSFSLVTATFNGINVGGGSAPAVTDLDGNGLLDLLVGKFDGTLAHYQQASPNSLTFNLVTTSFNGLDVGNYAAPAVTDLDGNGLLDLLVGKADGTLAHYQQASANSLSFTLVMASFNSLNVGGYATPTFNDLDGDGRLDLLVGTTDGNLAHYEQASANSLSFALVTNTVDGIDVGSYSAPALTDLDGDGLLDLLVGATNGTLGHYEQALPVPVLTDLTPTSGRVGTSVTLKGEGLSGATSVSFNGGLQTTITANTSTSLTVVVPTGAITGPVTVTTAGGTASSQPATVLRLQATAGTGVDKTVYLDQVELLQGGAVVAGGVANGSFETGAPAGVLNYDPTTVSAWTFASNGGRAALSTTGSAFAPPAPPDGSAHIALLQMGSPYLEQALSLPSGTYQVRFQLAQRQCCTAPYNQAVQVFINGVALGAALTTSTTGYVQLTSASFTVSNAGVFTVIPTPSVVSFSPASGPVGTVISLTGTNLTGATAITFAGSGANVVTTGFTVASATSITGVVVPEGAITGPLTVTTPLGTTAASATAFTLCNVTTKGQNASQALGAGGTATFAASAFDNGSYNACGGTLQPTLRRGGVAFDRASEGSTLSLTAPAGYTFTAVDFASYGTPTTNSSGDYSFGTCHAASSRSVVEAALLGRTGTVSIAASNANFGGDPCGGSTKRLAVRAFYTRSPVLGGVVFGRANENGTLSLTAPAGTVFTAVNFASYGTATGTNGNYALSSCHAASSRRVVEAALLGQTGTISIAATSANFGGDPCGVFKYLAVRAIYAPGSPTLAFDCSELGAQPVLLTFTDAVGATATATVTATVSVPTLPTTTWTGTASTAWTDCANWSYGLVPSATVSAVVPAGRLRYPALDNQEVEMNDLTVAAGATFTADAGSLPTLYGHLSSSGGLNVQGPLLFAGSAAVQTISITSADRLLQDLTVSKTSGRLSLAADLNLPGRLKITRGLVSTNAYKVVLGPTATIDETETAYVTGTVETTRALSTAGAANTFGGLGLTLTPAAASAALPGSTRVRRVTGSPVTDAGGRVGIGRYFDIQPTTDANLNVAMVFGYFEHELNGIPEANLQLFKGTGTTAGPWVRQTPITADAAANTVRKTNITSLSLWTLGNSAAPLPVELLSFTAAPQGPAVALTWRTASEKNSARFEVERSAGGKQFEKIGEQEAQGTKASPTSYAYLDQATHFSTTYYRLRQVDLDGSFSYSPVRTVTVGRKGSLTLYPNPARTTVAVAGLNAGASVGVFDALGRAVATATAEASGTARLALPAGLAAGVYIVRSGTQVRRLTVE